MIYNPVEIRFWLIYIRACEAGNIPIQASDQRKEGNTVVTNLGVFGNRLHDFGKKTEEMNMPMIVYTRRRI